ncbi:MAG: type II secretion system protein GspD [Gammaproteobacteria bacterium]|nr:type II secretion system protein GspD [Gammaproteobacteria bacterium]
MPIESSAEQAASYTRSVRERVRSRMRALVLAGCLTGLSSAALAEAITLNLKDADIGAVITTVADVTGKNFIVDPRVKGKVTIISSRPMDKDAVYQVFLSLLSVHGFSAVETGNVVKILPDANAKQNALPVVDDTRHEDMDAVVTRIIELRNVSAAQLVPILRPLVPQQGHLAAYVPGNILIISDHAANIQRMVEIIERIDLPSNDDIEIITLKHASAADISRTLTTLTQSAKAAGRTDATPQEAPIIIADERTNSILLGGDKSGRLRLRTLISHLDTPLVNEGNTNVIYLHYARAKDLVPILSGVNTSLEQQAKAKGGPAAQSNSPVNIQADESTNSLIITAPPSTLSSLQSVVRQLDIRRAQVLVESVIAEVQANMNNELGIEWVVDSTPGGNGPIGVSNFGNISGVAASVINKNLPTLPSGLTLGIGRFNSGNINFAAILHALKGDASTNILSTPSLITLDNQEAEIVVGQEVPFVTGSFTSTGSTSTVTNPFQTINRKNVGLTLKVTPQINEGNSINLSIDQSIDSLSASTLTAVDLITNKRSIKTSILVEDGQTVVLGGLIKDDLKDTTNKVPLLGDIPVLGWLFTSKSTTKEKTNLMVFLRPTIIRDNALVARISDGKYQYIEGLQKAMKQRNDTMLPQGEMPVIEPLNDYLPPPPTEESP